MSYKRSRDVNSKGLREKIVNPVGLRGVVYKSRRRHGQVTNMQKNHWTAASRDGKMGVGGGLSRLDNMIGLHHRHPMRISDWLLIVFHFGNENWEEHLKKTPCTNTQYLNIRQFLETSHAL